MAITTQTQNGVGGALSAGAVGGGADSVWKLNVADQSLGAGSMDIIRQK